MIKEKIISEIDSNEYGNGYYTYMNYFATGEGMTHEIQFCWADNVKEAVIKHLDRFGYLKKEEREYVGGDIQVFEYKSADAKNLLKQFLKNGNKIFNIAKNSAFDFQLKLYWNLS